MSVPLPDVNFSIPAKRHAADDQSTEDLRQLWQKVAKLVENSEEKDMPGRRKVSKKKVTVTTTVPSFWVPYYGVHSNEIGRAHV